MTDIALLIRKFLLNEELNQGEKLELEQWKGQSEANQRIFERLTNDAYLLKAFENAYKIDSDEVALRKINALLDKEEGAGIEADKPKIRSLWPRLAAAAVIVFAVVSGAVYLLRKNEKPYIVVTTPVKQDVPPGTFKASLQLADGRLIVIDSAATGQLVQQGSTKILNKDGQLVYAAGSEGENGEVLWNTLSTARGQTYPLLLSDGSRITLNSESSIRFPVAFTGDTRQVEITGEVFFEVAHNSKMPFIARAKGVDIRVLGTKFNVNAYDGEDAIKTTLVEGSVNVSKGIQRKQIRPGQQAQVLPNEIKVVENVDIDKITAWRQGFFRFKEDQLSEAMKNIARWYNIEVVFEGNAAGVEISGNIHRSSNLSEVVKLLAAIDVEARIEGKKLVLKAK